MHRALLLLVLVPLAAARAQDDEVLAKEIREATAKATKAIAKALTPPPPGPLPKTITFVPSAQARPLEALALLRAGGEDEKKLARKLLDEWWQDHVGRDLPSTNYELALAISAHEGLTVERIESDHPTTVTRYEAKPIADDVKERLALLVRTLVASKHATFDGRGCAWSYDVAEWQRELATTERRPRRASTVRRAREFDNSNAQFSVLALHDAARGGCDIPAEVVKEVAQHFLLCASRQKGPAGVEVVRWGYGERGFQASMTFAGLSSLAIARDLGFQDREVDRAIKDALLGIPALVDQMGDPPAAGAYGYGLPYDVYSLEKALDALDVKDLDGKDWFAPLARRVLKAQGANGLWASGDVVDSCFYVLFLTRATVSRTRLVDARSTGRGGPAEPLGEVFIAKTKKTVDAPALVRYYADAGANATSGARAAAEEALRALEAEGHGREAALLGALAALLRKTGDRKETGGNWTREVCGKAWTADDLEGWDASVRRLHEERNPTALRLALSEKAPLPVRALAATELARIPFPEAAPDVIAAVDSLAASPALETGAGARCARAFADSLASLTQSVLPAVSPKGAVTAAELRAVAEEARAKLRRALDDKIDRAQAAWEKHDPEWPKRKAEVSSREALRRMVDRKLWSLLRAATGELIPDDEGAWRRFLE